MIIVSNGSNIVKLGSRNACFKAGEAVIMRWDTNISCGEEGIE